jgi:hypothetical protein
MAAVYVDGVLFDATGRPGNNWRISDKHRDTSSSQQQQAQTGFVGTCTAANDALLSLHQQFQQIVPDASANMVWYPDCASATFAARSNYLKLTVAVDDANTQGRHGLQCRCCWSSSHNNTKKQHDWC